MNGIYTLLLIFFYTITYNIIFVLFSTLCIMIMQFFEKLQISSYFRGFDCIKILLNNKTLTSTITFLLFFSMLALLLLFLIYSFPRAVTVYQEPLNTTTFKVEILPPLKNNNFSENFFTTHNLSAIYCSEIPKNYVSLSDLLNTDDTLKLSKIYEEIFGTPPSESIKQNPDILRREIRGKVWSIVKKNFMYFFEDLLINCSFRIKNFELTPKQIHFFIAFLHKLLGSADSLAIDVFFPVGNFSKENIVSNCYCSISDYQKILAVMQVEIEQSDFLTNHFFYKYSPTTGVKRNTDEVVTLINLISKQLNHLYIKSAALQSISNSPIRKDYYNLFEVLLDIGEKSKYYYIDHIKFYEYKLDFIRRVVFVWLICFFIFGGLTFKYCLRKNSIFSLWYLKVFLKVINFIVFICFILLF